MSGYPNHSVHPRPARTGRATFLQLFLAAWLTVVVLLALLFTSGSIAGLDPLPGAGPGLAQPGHGLDL